MIRVYSKQGPRVTAENPPGKGDDNGGNMQKMLLNGLQKQLIYEENAN